MTSGRQIFVVLSILCCVIGSSGCSRKLTPEEVEGGLLALENHNPRSPQQTRIGSFQCRYGERDWEYICQARWEPTPLGVSRGLKLLVQKIGIRNAFLYEGKLGGGISVLPDEGPTPSRAELEAMIKQEAARATEKQRQRPNQTAPR